MAEAFSKVGIISCSGEEIPEGTVARQAVRRVLEALRPQQTVTLCLPLFLAGEEGERRFAREHPTITVDGCSKLCAKRGTEKYSGPGECLSGHWRHLGRPSQRMPSLDSPRRQGRRRGGVDRRRTYRVRSRCVGGFTSPGGTRGSNHRCGLLCLRWPVAEWNARNQGKAGRHRWPAADLPAASEEGIGTECRLRREVAANGQDLSFYRRPEEADYRDALVTAYQTYCQHQSKH